MNYTVIYLNIHLVAGRVFDQLALGALILLDNYLYE